MELHDAYISVVEALYHGGLPHGVEVEVKWIQSEQLCMSNIDSFLSDVDGILVPGGLANGNDGKICAIRYAREKGIPYFGICLECSLPLLSLHVMSLAWKTRIVLNSIHTLLIP